jgi:Fe-S cluster biogenesis protein NfuA
MGMEDVLTIRTERTPNPNSLKYILGRALVPGGSANFPTPDSAKGRSPLAEKIYEVPGVLGVFIGPDFFTLTRDDGVQWSDVNEKLAPALEAFFASGAPVLEGKAEVRAPMMPKNEADAALVARIEELLETKIRPAVSQDGGDIVFRGFAKGIVYLELHGSCSGCPSSSATLKAGIESMLKMHLEEVTEVQAI